jgi:hypothetical protein
MKICTSEDDLSAINDIFIYKMELFMLHPKESHAIFMNLPVLILASKGDILAVFILEDYWLMGSHGQCTTWSALQPFL